MPKANGSINFSRVSLAYAGLRRVPNLVIFKIATKIQFLDLSNNCIKDLSFLKYFHQLETLILDRNYQLDYKTLPPLMNLRVLWLNNCNLVNVDEWIRQLQKQCPYLTELSMMCNPVGRTQLNGFSPSDEVQYRSLVANTLPELKLLDGIAIKRKESNHLNIMQNILHYFLIRP